MQDMDRTIEVQESELAVREGQKVLAKISFGDDCAFEQLAEKLRTIYKVSHHGKFHLTSAEGKNITLEGSSPIAQLSGSGVYRVVQSE
jgi:hypothetical protein